MSHSTRSWSFDAPNAPLRLRETQTPSPGPHEVLLRVRAVSLNYRDLLVQSGAIAGDAPRPFVPTSDASGEIIACGEGVTRARPGDRVATHYLSRWIDGPIPIDRSAIGQLGGPLPGVLATHVVLHEDAVVHAPRSLDHDAIATLPIAALTAWNALGGARPVGEGDVVVVQGTGGVALLTLRFAVARGARVVVTSTSAEKLARVSALGAASTIDSRTEPAWDEAVLRYTSGRGADRIVEIIGGANVKRSLNAVRGDGEIALVGVFDGFQIGFSTMALLQRQVVLRGIGVGNRRQFDEMNRAIDEHGIEPVIDAVYPFEEAPGALEHLRRGPFGKVVIRVE